MTYDEVNDSMAFSNCPYHYHKPDVQGLYVKFPQNVCDLNEFMCGGPNRTGLLCSSCKPELGPAVFSYTLTCLKCLDSGYGWLLYMFLAIFPTTVMFLVVIICQIRITAAPMNAFIFVSQVLLKLNHMGSLMFQNPVTTLHCFSSLYMVFSTWTYFAISYLTFVYPA